MSIPRKQASSYLGGLITVLVVLALAYLGPILVFLAGLGVVLLMPGLLIAFLATFFWVALKQAFGGRGCSRLYSALRYERPRRCPAPRKAAARSPRGSSLARSVSRAGRGLLGFANPGVEGDPWDLLGFFAADEEGDRTTYGGLHVVLIPNPEGSA